MGLGKVWMNSEYGIERPLQEIRNTGESGNQEYRKSGNQLNAGLVALKQKQDS